MNCGKLLAQFRIESQNGNVTNTRFVMLHNFQMPVHVVNILYDFLQHKYWGISHLEYRNIFLFSLLFLLLFDEKRFILINTFAKLFDSIIQRQYKNIMVFADHICGHETFASNTNSTRNMNKSVVILLQRNFFF